MTKDELLACPFCGGNARRQDLTDEGNEGGSCIACDQCGASSPVHFDRKENLYDSWNRRSTSSAERGLREACQAMLDDHMTSETHHPGYVLVPAAAFGKVRATLDKATKS